MKAQCQCGALTAEIEDGALPVTILCHCVDCQRRTGTPFGTMAYFPIERVKIAGKVKEYSRPADSGSTFTTGFCPTCGSSLYALTARLPAIVGIAVGAIGNGVLPPPAVSVYEQSLTDWIRVPQGTHRHPRGRDS